MAIGDKLERTLQRAGLREFGREGDEFDPTKHEAVIHDESDSVSVPTCTKVLRKGYTFKDRLLRPAMVGVTDPLTFTVPTTTETPSARSAEPVDDAGPDETSESQTEES